MIIPGSLNLARTSTAPSLGGPWYDLYWQHYQVPVGTRHGCMLPITQGQHDALVAAIGRGAG